MLKNYIKKGLFLGLISGLLTTIIEGLFMLPLNCYISSIYPVHLYMFNIIFWTSFGMFCGYCHWWYAHKKIIPPQKESFNWIVFYILPFTIFYGLLSKIDLVGRVFSDSSDHHLSII